MQILGLYITSLVFTRTLFLGHDLAHILVSLLQNSFSTTTRQKKNFSTSKCNVYQAYHSPDWTKFAISTQSPSFFGGANTSFLKKNLTSHYMHKIKKIIAKNIYNVFAIKSYSSDTRKNEKCRTGISKWQQSKSKFVCSPPLSILCCDGTAKLKL